MEEGCIYCGAKDDLSKSDVIPDALTNAKIINPNVCRIEHNNRFSDLFENEVISKFALITNELDIKSSKGKTYAAYNANFLIGDTEYSTKMSSETDLFKSNKKMRSVDGKILLGAMDEIKKIKVANSTNISEIDVNEIEIEKRVSIDLSIYFSSAMFRLVAKIAFEWYCVKNAIKTKKNEFLSVIEFITTGKGHNIVSFVDNPTIYTTFKNVVNLGSHALLAYLGVDNSVNVIVNLFGIAIYNVRLCDKLVEDCNKNVLFQELTLDAKHIYFSDTNIKEFHEKFMNCFESKSIGIGVQAMIPKDMTDTTLKYKLDYINNYEIFRKDLKLIIEPTEETVSLLLNNIQTILQESPVTIRGLKRFVKEHKKSFEEGLRLNPKGTNKKALFMFYMLFVIGRSDGKIKNLKDLNYVLKSNFSDSTINLNDELSIKLNKELFDSEKSVDWIVNGAKAVDEWDYE